MSQGIPHYRGSFFVASPAANCQRVKLNKNVFTKQTPDEFPVFYQQRGEKKIGDSNENVTRNVKHVDKSKEADKFQPMKSRTYLMNRSNLNLKVGGVFSKFRKNSEYLKFLEQQLKHNEVQQMKIAINNIETKVEELCKSKSFCQILPEEPLIETEISRIAEKKLPLNRTKVMESIGIVSGIISVLLLLLYFFDKEEFFNTVLTQKSIKMRLNTQEL